MKNYLIVHPFLFAIYPILFLFSHNIEQIPISQTFVPTVAILGPTLLLLLLTRLLFKKSSKPPVIISFAIALIFSYGHIFTLLHQWEITYEISRNRFMLPLFWVLLFLFGSIFLIRIKKDLGNLNHFLNVVSIALIAISSFNIGLYQVKLIAKGQDAIKIADTNVESEANSNRPDILPDIYYIVMDRYANDSIFKEKFNYDNSDFTNYLRNKGFYIAEKSRCNFPSTTLSLATSLNMEIPHFFGDSMEFNRITHTPEVISLMLDYKVWRFLKSKGYIFANFGTWTSYGRKNEYADINFNKSRFSEFSSVLVETTAISLLLSLLNYSKSSEQIERVIYKFDELSKLPMHKEPIFTFALFLIPHNPFVFDKDGPLTFTERMARTKRGLDANYIDQVAYVNKELKILIDKLLADSEVPPIIILQSDEGPRPGKEFEATDQLSDDSRRTHMRILNAFYLPNVDNSSLYSSISPVNNFRLVFNLYFNTNYDMVDDISYGFMSVEHKKFIDITDIVTGK